MDVSHTLSRGFYVVDLAGVFAGALAGTLTARRLRDYDVVGVAALALASGVGGGILRDTLVQQGTPLALTNPSYLLTTLLAFGVGWLFGNALGPRVQRAILVIDAVALGWFAVASSLRCLDAKLGTLPVLLLGVIGAVGGGLMRDLLSAQTPSIFRRGELYALAALAASATFVLLETLHTPRLLNNLMGASVGAGLRMLSLRYGWQAPRPRSRSETR